MFAAVTVCLLLGAILALRAYRSSDAGRWARERSLVLDPAGRDLVDRYLRRSRAAPPVGAAAGVAAGLVLAGTSGDDFDAIAPLALGLGGYLLAALAAELTLRRPRLSEASLRRRMLGDYLPRGTLRTQRGVAVAAGGVALAALVVPSAESDRVPVTVRVSVLVAALLVGVVTEVLQRWLISRPQPHTLSEIDDAIRAQSLSTISAAGTGLACVVAGCASWILAQSDVGILRTTMWLVTLVAWGAAAGSCASLDHARAWRNRRVPA